MEFFRIKKDIPFMRYALIFNVISVITFLVAVGSLATRGLNFGIDFTGGTLIETRYEDQADLNKIRAAMTRLNLNEASVQNFGSTRDVLIRLPVKEGLRRTAASSPCSAWNSSGQPSARSFSRTAQWRFFSSRSASCSTCGCALNGSSESRPSLRTCTTS
jgi:preprotein translocase subunit SecF